MLLIFLGLIMAQSAAATDGVTILFTGDIRGQITEVVG